MNFWIRPLHDEDSNSSSAGWWPALLPQQQTKKLCHFKWYCWKNPNKSWGFFWGKRFAHEPSATKIQIKMRKIWDKRALTCEWALNKHIDEFRDAVLWRENIQGNKCLQKKVLWIFRQGNSSGYLLLKYHSRNEVAKTTTDMSETHKSILTGLTTWYDCSPKITL